MPNETATNLIIDTRDHNFSGSLTFTGVSHAADFVTTTTALSLASSTHAGKVVISGTANLIHTLPLATSLNAGDVFSVLTGVASTSIGTAVIPSSTDAVNGGTSGLGLKNTAATDVIGDLISVKSTGSTWWTVGKIGTWAAST